MKKKISRLLSLLVLATLTVPTTTSAQSLSDNGIFYHSYTSPWSSSLNPALFPQSAAWYITLPRFSADLSLPFSFKDLNLQHDPTRDVTVFNATDFANLMVQRKFRFSTDVGFNLLGVGFSIGPNLHFTLDVGAKAHGLLTLPIEVTRLLTEGNLNENRHLQLGTALPFSAMAYAYASAGVAYHIPDGALTVGARFNMLAGYAMASIDHLTLDVTTSADTSSLSLLVDYQGRFSSPYALFHEINTNENTIFPDFLPENLGYTFDLGAKFSLFNIDFSASILDLGPGITWSDYTTVITPPADNHPIEFDGFDLNRVNEQGYFNSWLDTLKHKLDFQEIDTTFRYTPPTRIYFGASFSLLQTLKIGYLFHGEIESGLFNPVQIQTFRMNNSLSLNVSLFKWFELTLANSLAYDGNSFSLFNPGLAISLNPFRRIQFYAAVDYISNFHLVDMRAAHIYFGINLYGHR